MILTVQVISHDPSISQEMIGNIESAAEVAGRRVSPLPRSNKRVRALFSALISCHLIASGFRNRDLKGRVAHLLEKNPNEITTGQMSYDLRRLRGHGIIEKVEGTHRYELTEEGLRLSMFITRVERRVYREGMPLIIDDDHYDSRLRKAFDRFEVEINKLMEEKLALAR